MEGFALFFNKERINIAALPAEGREHRVRAKPSKRELKFNRIKKFLYTIKP